MLNKPIFPDHLSILENPFIPRYWGSAPFDDEGVRPSERLVVDHGVLSGLFLSSYSARKLGMTTTGNAGGPYNLIFSEAPEASEKTLSALLSRMGTGLLVTELIGQGVNYTTGDFSKGASGFWVEKDRLPGGRHYRCWQSQRHLHVYRSDVRRRGLERLLPQRIGAD